MISCTIDAKGYLSLQKNELSYIFPSPAGVLVYQGNALLPLSAEQNGEEILLHYACGDCLLRMEEKTNYRKLTVLSVCEEAEGFVFGPYRTDACEAGEILGAGWYADGRAACIQSLMPKVEGGCKIRTLQNKNGLPLHEDAGSKTEDAVYLQCSVSDRTKPSVMDYLEMKNVLVKPALSPDSEMAGASVALLAAESREELLSVISEMEIAEGLPHPLFQGSYVKTDRRASSYYMIIGGSGLTNEEKIAYAGRAGVSCIYFSDLLESWGHFKTNAVDFPEGVSQVAALSDLAAEYQVDVGTHTLSNFIQTYDSYVTPVPHDGLLVMDETVLIAAVSESDTSFCVAEEKNFSRSSTLNVFRIGDELVTFSAFDRETCILTDCTRGAFGTTAAPHPAGTKISRLWDHGYRTLFPDIELQREMAGNLGRLIRDGKLHRMSFDGLEGCSYTDGGEYAMADFVQKVLDIVGNDIVCEGSRITHYLWHAYTYCNWGEPWYDCIRRGGMHAYRAGHIPFFRRNLMPNMLGWYGIWLNRGRYEATPPENVEFILSRSVAYDAGMALFSDSEVPKKHGCYGQYLDYARLWGDFRIHADIPEAVRELMQDENGSWHLEKTEDGWNLSQMIVRTQDLDYTDRVVKAEAGYVDNCVAESDTAGKRNHSSHLVSDFTYDGVTEENLNFRIRVGEPGHGYLENLSLPALSFAVTAEGGDYLIYNGGMELIHCDADFNVKEIITGTGRPLTRKDLWFTQLRYTTDCDDAARYLYTELRTRRTFHIRPLNK